MTEDQYIRLKAEPETYAKLCNGIGPDKYRAIIQKVFGKGLFRQPADIHDVDTLAGGTETDREESEAKFLANCIHWIAEQGHKYDPRFYWYAFGAYGALKAKGGDFWNYRSKPIPHNQLLKIARSKKDEKTTTSACYNFPDNG